MTSRTVAILGASTNRAKFGNKSVRAHQVVGYTVYPVNPRAQEIEGLKCFPSLQSVPQPVHRISVYLPPALGLLEWEAIAAAKPKEVWLNPGADSTEMIRRGKELGLNVIAGCSIVDLGVTPSQFPD